jgi:hypothetical protein
MFFLFSLYVFFLSLILVYNLLQLNLPATLSRQKNTTSATTA